ncbi:MAG: hypothetical protein V1779_15090 [bacterium]
MKKYIATILISFILAVLSVDGVNVMNRRIIPIVFSIERLPRYWRKKALKFRFFPSIISR